jgi:hypothetical protein
MPGECLSGYLLRRVTRARRRVVLPHRLSVVLPALPPRRGCYTLRPRGLFGEESGTLPRRLPARLRCARIPRLAEGWPRGSQRAERCQDRGPDQIDDGKVRSIKPVYVFEVTQTQERTQRAAA